MELNELVSQQATKTILLEKAFEQVFKKIKSKIKIASKKNHCEFYYEIIQVQFGFITIKPQYLVLCKNYLINKFKDSNIQIIPNIFPNNPRIIYITWQNYLDSQLTSESKNMNTDRSRNIDSSTHSYFTTLNKKLINLE